MMKYDAGEWRSENARLRYAKKSREMHDNVWALTALRARESNGIRDRYNC